MIVTLKFDVLCMLRGLLEPSKELATSELLLLLLLLPLLTIVFITTRQVMCCKRRSRITSPLVCRKASPT